MSTRPRLTPTQKDLLRVLPGWQRTLDVIPLEEKAFNANCEAYVTLATQLGRAPSQTTAATAEERQLTRWLIDMKGYHSNNNMLTTEQQQKLEKLPYFVWGVKHTGKKGPGTRERPQLD